MKQAITAHEYKIPVRKFEVGQVVGTRVLMDQLPPLEASLLVVRHQTGDYGDLLCDEDKHANTNAIKNGDRILSKYKTQNGDEIYIITESDRSLTTLMLCEEY